MKDKSEKWKNKEFLYQKYIEEKLTIAKIAKMCGVSAFPIVQLLKKHNIKTRKGGPPKGTLPWNTGKTNIFSREKNPMWKGGCREFYQSLSRKAWEKFWMQKVPEGYLVHHVDRDFKNIEITNLASVTRASHINKIHIISKKGKIAWNKGKTGVYSEEAIQKMRETRLNWWQNERIKKSLENERQF